MARSKTRKVKNRELAEELDEIRRKENLIMNKLNIDINKEKVNKHKTYMDVMHLTFNDFAQIVIGCCVFGLPAFINTSFWDYLPLVETHLLIYIHIFFIFCVMLALNYEFRDNFSTDLWFIKMLSKRFFYTYFSVMMVVILLIILVNKMNYSLMNIEVFRNFLAAQSVGMFGAVTFSFLKK